MVTMMIILMMNVIILRMMTLPDNFKIAGENGTGAKLKLSKYMQPKSEAGFKKYQFNVLASDIISVRRRLPDIRSN